MLPNFFQPYLFNTERITENLLTQTLPKTEASVGYSVSLKKKKKHQG